MSPPEHPSATRMAALLHPSEAVHRVVLTAISDAVFITDGAGDFTYICPNVSTIFGCSFEEAVALGNIRVLFGDALPRPNDMAMEDEVKNLEINLRDRRGAPHILLVNIKRVSVEAGCYLYTCRDITERKQVEDTLAKKNAQLFEEVLLGRDQLRELARQVVSAQEQERARISRELHDEAGQYLTALQIDLKLCQEGLATEPDAVRERLGEARRLSETVIECIRLIAHGLRPPSLDTLGIGYTLRALCQEVGRRTRARVDFRADLSFVVAEATAITLYRFLQEALTNVLRHAQAKSVQVHLFAEDHMLCLSVNDDGGGFDAALVHEQSRGLGLVGMRERIELLGGQLEIRSQRGHGTRLTARLPLPSTDEGEAHR